MDRKGHMTTLTLWVLVIGRDGGLWAPNGIYRPQQPGYTSPGKTKAMFWFGLEFRNYYIRNIESVPPIYHYSPWLYGHP